MKKRDARLPISKGHEAMKPNISESTTPLEVRILDQVIVVWVNNKFLIASVQSQSNFTKKFQISSDGRFFKINRADNSANLDI